MPSASFLLARARVVPSITVHQEVITIFLSPVLPLPFPCHVLGGTQLCVTTQVPHFQHFWVFLKLINESMNQQMSFFWVYFSSRWNRIFFFKYTILWENFSECITCFSHFYLPLSTPSLKQMWVCVACVGTAQVHWLSPILYFPYPITVVGSHQSPWSESELLFAISLALCMGPSTHQALSSFIHFFISILY